MQQPSDVSVRVKLSFDGTPRKRAGTGDGDATAKASLDAHRRLEQPTREWLPAWLLEEASASGNGEGCKEGTF